MSPQELDQADSIARQIEQVEHNSSIVRIAVGVGFVAAAGAAIYGATQLDDARFAQQMPFSEQAQDAVNKIDDGLAVAGMIGLPVALAGIGVVKLGASRSNRLRSIDKRSSQELSDDGYTRSNIVRRGLRQVAAGSMPVVVTASAAVGALTAGIGTEITDGPGRPITAFASFAPGQAMVTQFPGAMPMLESTLSEDLTRRISSQSRRRGVEATTLQLGLNSVQNGSQTLTGLTLGVQGDRLPSEMRAGYGCDTVPVLVDSSAGIDKGTHLKINGVDSVVVGEAKNISAINRVGIVMDQEALERCVNKSETENSHAVVLDTDPETAGEILADAQGEQIDPETAVVISKDEYLDNSKDFWRSNVKPITNTLALVGLMTAFVAMGGNVMSRMLRNRRELAAKLAAGESVNQFRITEIVRGAKDGVLGSTVGVGLAAALTVPVNALESGMRVGLGLHEAAIGYAVGILGSVGGTLLHVIRPKKIVDPSEHTRV